MNTLIGGSLVLLGGMFISVIFFLLNRQTNSAQITLNENSYKQQAKMEKIRTDQYIREKEADTILQREVNSGLRLQRDQMLINDGRSPAEC